MKKSVLLLLLVLAAGCEKQDPAAEEFEVQTLGQNPDCGQPMVTVLTNPARVAALVGNTNGGAGYLAVGLDTALWQSKSQRLLIRVRKPLNTEYSICKAYGPAYPWLAVVSARVK